MKKVGKVFYLDLNSDKSYVNIIVIRDESDISPIILGQFIVLFDEKKPNQKYLAVVEQYAPDIDFHQNKNAIKMALSSDSSVDDNYKRDAKGITYRARLQGIIQDTKDFKFYSNVRDLPIITDLDVYVPSEKFMQKLFKSAVSQSDNSQKQAIFEIGNLKYGTFPEYTEKFYGKNKKVPIYFDATNLLRKRTGIFGKSGYGKSNTVKTVIGMMATKHPNCGQLIIDTNGEYPLGNTQNDGLMDIFHEAELSHKITLYTSRKIHDEKRVKYGSDAFKPLRFDVFENLAPAIEIILTNFNSGDHIPMYLEPWKNAVMGGESEDLFSSKRRQVKAIIWGVWFRCCLDAGLKPLNKQAINAPILTITKDFLDKLTDEATPDDLKEEIFAERLGLSPAALPEDYLRNNELKFSDLLEGDKKTLLKEYNIGSKNNSYFTNNIETMALYAEFKSQQEKEKAKEKKDGNISILGSSSIKGFYELLGYSRRLYQLKPFNIGELKEKGHKPLSLGEKVWRDLEDNKVVILDVASVPMIVAQSLSRQILGYLLQKASDIFGDTREIKRFNNFDALIYIEESQNYLSSEQTRGGGIYERLAKEGRKFHLGLVYITQQPSAIDPKITSQTENIIAMHMSNKEDTNVLNKIKDKFDDLTCRFLKDEAQKGLAYIYSEPHQPFVLPCQIHLFNKELVINSFREKD